MKSDVLTFRRRFGCPRTNRSAPGCSDAFHLDTVVWPLPLTIRSSLCVCDRSSLLPSTFYLASSRERVQAQRNNAFSTSSPLKRSSPVIVDMLEYIYICRHGFRYVVVKVSLATEDADVSCGCY